jgi:hypothetical protein
MKVGVVSEVGLMTTAGNSIGVGGEEPSQVEALVDLLCQLACRLRRVSGGWKKDLGQVHFVDLAKALLVMLAQR